MSDEYIYLSISTLIFFFTALPLALEKIGINRWYGIRFGITMKNENVWYRINKIYGVSMMISNILFFALTLSFGFFKNGHGNYIITFSLFLFQVLVPVLIVVFNLLIENEG